jgi:hypothetical protein
MIKLLADAGRPDNGPRSSSRPQVLRRMGKKMQNVQITIFNPLQPAVLRTMREAFDDAVRHIEQTNGSLSCLSEDALSKLSRRIVDRARQGESDFNRLRSAALGIAAA